MQSSFTQFVRDFCDGQLRLTVAQACRLAGVNAQSIRQARVDSRRHAALPAVRVGCRLFVNSIDVFNYLGGEAAFPAAPAVSPPAPAAPIVRRGAPTRDEKLTATRRGMSVSQLRKEIAREVIGGEVVA